MEHYYGQMLNEQLISREYYDKNTKDQYAKEDILSILKASDISQKSVDKYEKFLK